MTLYDKIQAIEGYIEDCKEAYKDDYYAAICPTEWGTIPDEIRRAENQLARLEEELASTMYQAVNAANRS